MMNRIDNLFKIKKQYVLSVYFTAGYPKAEDTSIIIKKLEKYGADMVEIGIPFSDPLADGAVIQKSSNIALQNGMTVKKLFNNLQKIKDDIKIPMIIMSYLNPVLQFGIDNFLEKCKNTGIDGLIIPDLPYEIFNKEYKNKFKKYGIHNIMLISPLSDKKRIQMIAKNTEGFIYLISNNSITGHNNNISNNKKCIEIIKDANKNIPVLIGFGIDNKEKVRIANEHSSGVIVGSSFINCLKDDYDKDIKAFINNLKNSK